MGDVETRSAPNTVSGQLPSSNLGGTMPAGEDLTGLQGLSLDSSPVKPSSSSQTRSSSSEPSSAGANMPMFVQQEGLEDVDDDDDEEGGRKGKKGAPNPGRRKIEIEYIEDKSKRHITFSKRKAGIMKKAYELSTLTGTQVLLLVVSETGLVYTYTTNKLQPLVTAKEGKALIQACLTAEEGEPPFGDKADMPPLTPTRTRADHRKVSMQVRMDPDRNNTYNPNNLNNGHIEAPMPSPSYMPQSMQQQQQQGLMQQHNMPQMMQPPYMSHPGQQTQQMQQPQQMQQQQQQIQSSLLPSAPMGYQQPMQNSMPMAMNGMPPMPMPAAASSDNTGVNSRTLKKRKTVDNLRLGKESAEQTEARRTEATQLAQAMLDQARQNPTVSNLLRAYQQQDIATRAKPAKLNSDGTVAEGLDSTVQLFQMSCEDSARGPEADQARLRGERWIDHVGVAHLQGAFDSFLHDFLVNKCIRTAKDLKAAAKDLHNFSDWLFAHSFVNGDFHTQLVRTCGGNGKAVKKRGSESSLSTPVTPMMTMAMPPMPNGLVRPPSNPAARAESAGKTLIDFCEYARAHYDGLGQEQGVTALNGYFIVERVRSTYCILRGIPIEGDPHSNSEPGPFKVRMPRQLTNELRPRDQFLLSLNRYVNLNYWVPTACGDVHPTTEEEMGEDPLNPQYHHMEAEKAQQLNDQFAFNYHATEYQYASKVVQMLDEGDLPEDGFGGVSVQQVLHGHPSQDSLSLAGNDPQRPVRRQPSRARVQSELGTTTNWNEF